MRQQLQSNERSKTFPITAYLLILPISATIAVALLVVFPSSGTTAREIGGLAILFVVFDFYFRLVTVSMSLRRLEETTSRKDSPG